MDAAAREDSEMETTWRGLAASSPAGVRHNVVTGDHSNNDRLR